MTDIPPYVQRWCDEEGYKNPYRNFGYWWATHTHRQRLERLPFSYEVRIAEASVREILSFHLAPNGAAIAAQLNAAIAQISSTLSHPDTMILPAEIARELLEGEWWEPPESTDPLGDAIDLLVQDYKMPQPLATLRLKEFAAQQRFSMDTLYKLLRRGQVQVRKGVLCPGKGFPKQRGTQHG